MEGTVLSEADSEVRIEVSNSKKTIFTTRVIPRTDIQSIQRETPEQKSQRESFEKLAKFQLNPNQELTSDQYAEGIAAFDKFLAKYPNSSFAEDINKRIADWRAEASNVESGKVKSVNKWMTPEEKKVQAELWQKQADVQAAQNALQLLKKQLASLQAQRGQLAEDLGVAQGNLAATKTTLANLQDTQEPVYDTKTVYGSQYDPHSHTIAVGPGIGSQSQTPTGYKTVPNPQRAILQSSVAFYQKQVGQGQAALATLDAKIRDIQFQIPKLEQNYGQAVARVSAPTQPTKPSEPAQAKVKPPPTPSPPKTPPPPPPKPEPKTWYVRLWNWIHGSGSQ